MAEYRITTDIFSKKRLKLQKIVDVKIKSLRSNLTLFKGIYNFQEVQKIKPTQLKSFLKKKKL